jgi:integrase
LSTVSPRSHPIRSAITVAGIVGQPASSSRIRGSNASTADPAGFRSYLGGPSLAIAARTVFLEIPSIRAISLIASPSPRCSLRISAQSSTDNTPSPPGSISQGYRSGGQNSPDDTGSFFRRRRHVRRFNDVKYRTAVYEDPEEARADAMAQITEQLVGTWQKREPVEPSAASPQEPAGPPSGADILLEEWIDIWVGLLDDIEPTTVAKYRYFTEGHILPQFQGRTVGSLTFEEIEAWEKAIPTRISARGRPYAQSVATGSRALLITIMGDAVHAGRLTRNPALRRRGRRGRMRAKGRAPAHAAQQQSTANVLTPFQALRLAERCALLSGRDTDFVINIFDAWTGVRWGELLGVEGWDGKDSPLQITDDSISTYAVDWQLRELGGVVRKSAPKDGSYRVLDLPPFLAHLMKWARDNRRRSCACPLTDDGRAACKGEDDTEPNYLFLGPDGGHPRRSNYADRRLTPAAEGLYPPRRGIRRPVYITASSWPGIPIRKATASPEPRTSPAAPGPILPAPSILTTTATPTPPGSTPPNSAKSSKWTAAATLSPAWTPSTTTSPPPCGSAYVPCSKPCGTKQSLSDTRSRPPPPYHFCTRC